MSARDVIAKSLTRHSAHGVTKYARYKTKCVLHDLHAAGYAVVPVKPTEAMNIAGREARRGMGANVDVYQAMIAAAQEETT